MNFNSTNKFIVTVYVCAGGGGGGGSANSNNAGAGGGGGGLAIFQLNQSSTSFDQINFTIGAGGKYATGTNTDNYAQPGGNTSFSAVQSSTTLLSCTSYGGGYGGNGKGNGGNGGSGGGSGSFSNTTTNPGSGSAPVITGNDDAGIGYTNIFLNGSYSGGKGQGSSSDSGG